MGSYSLLRLQSCYHFLKCSECNGFEHDAARCNQNSEDIGDRGRSRSKYPRKAYRSIIMEGGPFEMLNDKETMQIAQNVDAIEIVPNHETMAQEQASNLSKNISEKEIHGNHPEGLAAATVEPSFQIPTIQVTIDHEE
ncbi:hypothetical protein QYF36_012277 [Acer negundo]|nr:hypothetical protein QYF36_012277 [Acer negundo]